MSKTAVLWWKSFHCDTTSVRESRTVDIGSKQNSCAVKEIVHCDTTTIREKQNCRHRKQAKQPCCDGDPLTVKSSLLERSRLVDKGNEQNGCVVMDSRWLWSHHNMRQREVKIVDTGSEQAVMEIRWLRSHHNIRQRKAKILDTGSEQNGWAVMEIRWLWSYHNIRQRKAKL